MSFPDFVPIGIVPPRATGKQSALEKALAQRASRAAAPAQPSPAASTVQPEQTAEDALYARTFGAPQQPPLPAAEDALYRKAFG